MATLRSLDDQIRISIREGQRLLLGRLPSCDVQLEDGSVSSRHAQLKLEDSILQLHDLDSTNGTRINYAQVEGPTLVLDGDTIEFGNVTFTVDGPELRSPEDVEIDIKAMTSLEPIDPAEALGNTMQIEGLEEIPLEEAAPTTEPPPAPALPFRDPVKTVCLIAAALIVVAGAILFTPIASIPPHF